MRRSTRSRPDQIDTPADARVAQFAAARDGVVSIGQLRRRGLDDDAVAVRVRCGWLHAGVQVVTRGGPRRIDGVRVHRSRSLERRDVRWRDGIPVTSPARTLLDLAVVLSPRALRRAARQAQALRVVSVRELIEICDRCRGHRGAAKLRAVVADGPAPTASPLEDDLLDLLDAAGIERPEINVALRLGGRKIIPDFLWRESRLAIEADSVTWHDHKLIRENDADKQAILEAQGFRVMRITHDQVRRRPQQTLARIRAALGTAC